VRRGSAAIRCGQGAFAIDFSKRWPWNIRHQARVPDSTQPDDRLQEDVMQARFAVPTAVAALAVIALVGVASATIGHPNSPAVTHAPPSEPSTRPLILAQNLTSPFSLPEMPEPPVSPINPGTLPGTTSAIGGSATGTNPITGLPCNGSGSISVSGAGGLPGTATPPPGLNETLGQIPVGTPPFTSIYGSQTNLGSC
jgi:hypothetical protein